MHHSIIQVCRTLAGFTQEPGFTTRTFLSPPMRDVHRVLGEWMLSVGMRVTVDEAGNLRGYYPGGAGRRLLIGSHLDTVPHAGAFDGILGVVMGIALVDSLQGAKLPYGIEVAGFSEEEGVRFGAPFIGSRALVGSLDGALLSRQDADGITVREAITHFGLDPNRISDAALSPDTFAYLEFHIEQGPVLESLDQPLGIVVAIAGQSRYQLQWEGKANHAGTTPMHLRRDALAAAAEWIVTVAQVSDLRDKNLVATVGQIEAHPGAGNVIPGLVRTSLDVRHHSDQTRSEALNQILKAAESIATRRGIQLDWTARLEQPAVPMDPQLTNLLAQAAPAAPRMTSGAGHDAMILASKVPTAMLFLRSPGGISHHPEESVLPQDVEAAFQAGRKFLQLLEAHHD